MPILVFLGLSVLDLGPMYATNVRQTDVRRKTASLLLMPLPRGGGIINYKVKRLDTVARKLLVLNL